jgi:YD repeat-containing protein
VGRLLAKSNNKKVQQKYEYDARGNVTKKTEANNALWTYSYDEANQLIETKSPEVLVGGIKRSISTRTTYDSFGNVISVVRDAEGIKQKITYEYDLNNQKVKTTYPDVKVNQVGTKASAQREEGSKNLCEELKYDAFGQVIAQSDKANHWSYSIYDKGGRLVYSINTQGTVTGYDYNVFNDVRSKTRFATAITVLASYTPENLLKVLKASSYDRTDNFIYDSDGKVIEVSQKEVRCYNAKTKKYSHDLKPTARIALPTKIQTYLLKCFPSPHLAPF